jgi:lysophospholipase L1-like esterase
LFSLFAALASLELILQASVRFLGLPRAVRLYDDLMTGKDTGLYMPDPDCLYRHRAGAHRDAAFVINEDGFRDSIPIKAKRSPNEIRVFVVGGSTSFDIACTGRDAWPRRLERLLSAAFPKRTVHVVNGGVGGYTTAESIPALRLRGMSYRPDFVLIHHVYNDVNARCVKPGFRADYRHYRPDGWRKDDRPPALKRSMLYNTLAVKLGDARHYDSVYFMTMRDFDGAVYYGRSDEQGNLRRLRSVGTEIFERNIGILIGISRAGGAIPVLVTGPLRQASSWDSMTIGVREGNEALRRVADRTRTPLIDLASGFPEDATLFHPGDPMHTNAAGSALKARRIADGLIPLVRTLLKRR